MKPTVEVKLLNKGALLTIGDKSVNLYNQWAVTDKELLMLYDVIHKIKDKLESRTSKDE